MSRSIVFALGGTGGHLIPAQVTAERLTAANSDLSIQFVGHGLMKSRLVDHSKFDVYDVNSASFVWSKPIKAISSIGKLLMGVWQAYHFLSKRKPSLVVGFGSYHSFPVLMAAVIRRIPIVLHESNIKPGRVNRFFARYAKALVVAYAETRRYIKAPILQLKMPLRFSKEDPHNIEEIRKEYGLDPKKMTILVWGGSLGAQFLNREAIESFELLADQGYDFQVIHLCGPTSHSQEILNRYKKMSVHAVVKKYENQMDKALLISDFSISRCGAMTMAELIEHELPSLVIPYPFAMDKHQDFNANYFVEQVAGGVKLKEEVATPEKIVSILSDWFEEGNLEEIRSLIRDFKKSMPVKTLEELLKEYL